MIVSHPSLLSSSVLIPNRSYMAVHRVSVRQACLLLYREAAEVIDVVQQSVRFSRRNLFVRDQHPCYSLWQVFMPTPSATGRQVQKKA